jgi:hypothetical protein
MSIVQDITEAIEDLITSNLTGFQKSQYTWDTQKNSDSKNENYFAIRPLQAAFISGTCRTITIEQSFEVELGTTFRNKGDKDSDANDKILSLYGSHESLYRSIMRDNFNIGRVQVVGGLDIEAPQVDNDNKVCRIIASYSIRYRTE